MTRLRAACAVLALFLAGAGARADTPDILIASGAESGVYFAAASGICWLLRRDADQHGMNCRVLTGGSIENLRNLRQDTVTLAIAQADWQVHALHGTGPFAEDGADGKLRTLFSLHSEAFTVVARRDSDIHRFADLLGKRVNLGNVGSGQRGTMEVVMQVKGWTREDFHATMAWDADWQARALCNGTVDAIVYTVGHPNGSITEATTSCDSHLVPLEPDLVQAVLEQNPYYEAMNVPGGIYRNQPDPVPSFGVRGTVVASADLPEDAAYAVTKAVFGNLQRFTKMHPAFEELRAETMISTGLSAPLHPGAERYYRERGWIK